MIKGALGANFGWGWAMPDRIEREIEDILRKIDDFVPERTRRAARRANQPLSAAHGWLAHRISRISLNQVMMWALVAVVVSFIFRLAIPGAGWVMLGSLIVLATAFLLSLRGGKGTNGGTTKSWRGQPLDLSGPSLPNRIKGWFKGRNRKKI